MTQGIPTDAEVAILRVLWRRGPSTVREVFDELAAEHGTGYTTTLKLMQLMHERGLLKRDTAQRSHVYSPSRSQASVQTRLVSNFAEKVFGGSAAALVMRALDGKRPSAEELEQIRSMLDELEREGP